MKNILLWAGIAVLAFQDYFKKPVKPTRSQQFFQTGGTSQAFVEGTKIEQRKLLQKYFGKAIKIKLEAWRNGFTATVYKWNFKYVVIELMEFSGVTHNLTLFTDEGDLIVEVKLYKDDTKESTFSKIGKLVKRMFDYHTHIIPELPDEYFKLNEIAQAGDWELALEIAKGQELL